MTYIPYTAHKAQNQISALHFVLSALRRFINSMAVGLSAANAVCMGVLAIAAHEWQGTENAKRADTAVVVIQLIVLVGGPLLYLYWSNF